MDDRKSVRFVAPVALVVLVVGVILIVRHNATTHPSPKSTVHRRTPRAKGKYASQKFYVVQPGDILSSIAQKTGIPITTLETLNPDVVPNSVKIGQKIVLHR
jgi:LysM repeat protein